MAACAPEQGSAAHFLSLQHPCVPVGELRELRRLARARVLLNLVGSGLGFPFWVSIYFRGRLAWESCGDRLGIAGPVPFAASDCSGRCI